MPLGCLLWSLSVIEYLVLTIPPIPEGWANLPPFESHIYQFILTYQFLNNIQNSDPLCFPDQPAEMHQDACWWCSHATWSFTSIVICHRVLSMGLMSRARVKHKRAQVFEPHSLNSLPGGGVWRRWTSTKCATLQTPLLCDPFNYFCSVAPSYWCTKFSKLKWACSMHASSM